MDNPTVTQSAVEQRFEWLDMHDQADVLVKAYHAALEDAGGWVAHGQDYRGGSEFIQCKAARAAMRARAIWRRRERLCARIDAHPYDAIAGARSANPEHDPWHGITTAADLQPVSA